MGEPIQVGEARGGSRRVLVLAGVAVALLVGVVVLPGLLFGGGGSSPSTAEAFGPVELDAGVAPTSTTIVTGAPPPETVHAFTSKNPFRPLVDTSPATESTPEATTVTTPVFETDLLFPDDGYVFPDEDAPIASDPEPAAPTPAPPATPARQPDRVSLLEVFADPGGQLVATVRVNDITYQVIESNDFATLYRVVDLDPATRCARLLFGDAPFGLCEGDEVIR